MEFEVTYPNAGAGALNVTGRSTPISPGPGSASLLGLNPSSTMTSFSDPVPGTDGVFLVTEMDNDSTYESGEGRLYSLTFASVGGAGIATLDLTDINIEGDLVPNLFDALLTQYQYTSVGDATIAVGMACPPPPTPSPTPTFPFASSNFVATNNTGSPADQLTINFAEASASLQPITQNAPGCPAPSLSYQVGFPPVYYKLVVTWPAPCVDPGESVNFTFFTDCTPGCPAPSVSSYSFSGPPTPTPSPTPVPVGGLVELPTGGEGHSGWSLGAAVLVAALALIAGATWYGRKRAGPAGTST